MASADLGEFGPTDGQPVLYRFHRLYHVQGIIPWLLLPLAFVVLKENRIAQAAWILTPVALLAAIYTVVVNILQLDSGGAVQLNALFTIMVLGFSMVWLLAERIGKRRRFVTFLLVTVIWFGYLGVNLLSNGLGKSMTAIASLAAVLIPPITFAFVVAAWATAKSFGRCRFIACMGATLFGSLLIVASAIRFLFYPLLNRPINSEVAQVLYFSFFVSLLCFAGLLPFLVLLFVNSLWRKRFECVMGIRTNIQ